MYHSVCYWSLASTKGVAVITIKHKILQGILAMLNKYKGIKILHIDNVCSYTFLYVLQRVVGGDRSDSSLATICKSEHFSLTYYSFLYFDLNVICMMHFVF